METDPVPGTVLLEKYRVERVLGRGGMGVVLLVTHLELEEPRALKLLLREFANHPEVVARFLREAKTVSGLRSEHVAHVYDMGRQLDGSPYIVMEFLEGHDLAEELRRRSGSARLPPGDAVDYILQACAALAEPHAKGIVHRDIKPSNLFLTARPDGTPLVKVLDFGIAKASIASRGAVTRTGTVMGTLEYMSPEQIAATKDVDGRTDIWSLGIVLYECLNGRHPFDAPNSVATSVRASTEPPSPMDPEISPELQVVVLRCLEKNLAVRFPSVAALASALEPFASDRKAADVIVASVRRMHASAVTATQHGSPIKPPRSEGAEIADHPSPVVGPAVVERVRPDQPQPAPCGKIASARSSSRVSGTTSLMSPIARGA